MRSHNRLHRVFLAILVALIANVTTRAAGTPVEEIRSELMQLPYYGVFDFLAFAYEKGTVTLVGYAYYPPLKNDAARAVRRVAGVDEVGNKIEVLPASQNDDEIRWKTYYAIYRDSFLSRYAPGGGMLWGHRHPFTGSGLSPMGAGAFSAMEAAGDYPIHIVVKGGPILLYGVVDNQADRNLAELKTRGVAGSFGVDNFLTVEKGSASSK